jgi:hypothetical protein
MKFLTVFLILVLSFGNSFSKDFKGCYKGYYLFFPIIKNCIEYSDQKNFIQFNATVETLGIAKTFRKIHYYGESFVPKDNQNFSYFNFIQIEKNLKVIQTYFFNKNNIIFYKRRNFKGEENIIIKNVLKEKYIDPFLASLLLYNSVPEKKEGKLLIFYDSKKYKVPFKVIKEEKIKVNSKRYNTYLVEVKPNIKSEGILKTRGKWYVWIDKEMKFPVKIKASFLAGTINLYLERNFEYYSNK